MLIFARRASVLSGAAAALAAAAIAASPAAALPAAAGAGAPCPAGEAVQPFTAWQDLADYVLAPDGGLEAGGAAWTLSDGAAVVEGSEPYAGAEGDDSSLGLPEGSSAATAPICAGVEHRTMRFFVDGPSTGQLTVQAVYETSRGRAAVIPLGTIAGSGTWAPSAVIPMRVNELAPDAGDAVSVALRFTPRGTGSWRIDDVYVDPYRVR